MRADGLSAPREAGLAGSLALDGTIDLLLRRMSTSCTARSAVTRVSHSWTTAWYPTLPPSTRDSRKGSLNRPNGAVRPCNCRGCSIAGTVTAMCCASNTTRWRGTCAIWPSTRNDQGLAKPGLGDWYDWTPDKGHVGYSQLTPLELTATAFLV